MMLSKQVNEILHPVNIYPRLKKLNKVRGSRQLGSGENAFKLRFF